MCGPENQKMFIPPPPPPPPRRVTEIQRGEGVQEEVISEGVGGCSL